MHTSLLLNEQLLKIKKIWLKHRWTFRKRRRIRSWKHRYSGWKHSWNVPCTSPSAGGVGLKVLSCIPREIWQREFILGEKEGTGLGSSFLKGGIGKHLEPCRAVPAKRDSQISGVWLLFQGSEKCELFCSRKTQSYPSTNTVILVWCDTLCL